VDVGAVFLAGPFGLVITKGYNFASLLQGLGGSSNILTLVSDWKIDRGVARAQDVAMATKNNRIALTGGLDFINYKFDDMTVAVINAKGCATVQQKISGSFEKPVVENQSILNSLTGPVQKLLKKGRDDSVASLVTAGTVPASRPLAPATAIPFSAAILRSSACQRTLRVFIRCLLHNDSTPRRGLRT